MDHLITNGIIIMVGVALSESKVLQNAMIVVVSRTRIIEIVIADRRVLYTQRW